ncbi:MAG: RNA polymerase sigma-70 factor [Bacteroidales bacterium]|jgi:RNA polymerase sigma-70 factor (ECF subfamily)|nr:RNA polymerase sigma-70 factor [Bacteroidales bacterium]
MNLNDLSIQKKIQAGDIREFERLFMKFYEPLCHHADKILNDMDTAEDLVQEFFYLFWKNRETFTLKFSLNAYLYRSIRNNAFHYLEHLAIRKNYAENVFREFQDMMPAHLQTDVDLNDLGKAINATLEQMPERCSLIFQMNRFEGKKYREIAEILSISVKTVEAEMGKALQIFRKSLRDYIGDGAGVSN